jgi:phthiocerol/phenolphthiocerol synthesis type-I polyketide synthase E
LTSVELQAAVSELWQQTFGIYAIDVDSNFFELGGTSLIAVQLVAAIRERFSVELSLTSLFEHPTIRELAEELQLLLRDDEELTVD